MSLSPTLRKAVHDNTANFEPILIRVGVCLIRKDPSKFKKYKKDLARTQDLFYAWAALKPPDEKNKLHRVLGAQFICLSYNLDTLIDVANDLFVNVQKSDQHTFRQIQYFDELIKWHQRLCTMYNSIMKDPALGNPEFPGIGVKRF